MAHAVLGHRGRTRRATRRAWRARASCWRRSGCGCAPTTTSNMAGRVLLGHRELLPAIDLAWHAAQPCSTISRISCRYRRVTYHRAADRRHVRGRHLRKHTWWSTVSRPASACDKSSAVREWSPLTGSGRRCICSAPGALRAQPDRRRVRRLGDPPTGLGPESGSRRPKGQIDDLIGEIRTRADADQRVLHDADQEDGRRPHRPPAEMGIRALPASGGRHRCAGSSCCASCVRDYDAGRHQPSSRGPRPARGVAGGDPRRRQRRIPAVKPRPIQTTDAPSRPARCSAADKITD